MITNASEFPCIEATRCLLSEHEMGKRLTVKTLSNGSKKGYSDDLQNKHIVSFSKDRSRKQEWYIHLSYSPDSSDEEAAGTFQRVLQLRHSETGQYLACDETGRICCITTPDPSTFWWIERVNESSEHQHGSPKPTSEIPQDVAEPQYILRSKKYPQRRLTYTSNLGGLNGSKEEYQLIASKKNASIWTIKFTSGELCFVSNPVVHCQLRCNPAGQMSLNNTMLGWEVFRFIEVGNGDLYIASWTHFTKFLTSDSDGKVGSIDSASQSIGFSERWRLESAPGGNGLYIKNVASRRYLSVGRDKHEPLFTTTKLNDYAVWHFDSAHSQVYYLTSLSSSAYTKEGHVGEISGQNQIYFSGADANMHVSSRKTGPFLTANKQKSEEWKIEMTPDGDVTFFSVAHEKYLGCNSRGDVHTTTSKGTWTIWEKKLSPHGGSVFLSREHMRYLAVNEADGTLITTSGDEEITRHNSWRLDPRLPRSVSGGKIAGAMGLATAIAMPFAVLGAIEAAGATLTELGLIGLSVEALAGAGAGAAIGAGMAGTAAAKILSNKTKGELSDLGAGTMGEDFAMQRPISAWKSWIKTEANE